MLAHAEVVALAAGDADARASPDKLDAEPADKARAEIETGRVVGARARDPGGDHRRGAARRRGPFGGGREADAAEADRKHREAEARQHP